MVNGEQSILLPQHNSTVDPPGDDGFTNIEVPPAGLELQGFSPVKLTQFVIKIPTSCTGGNVLEVKVTYLNEFLSNKEVSLNNFRSCDIIEMF